MPLDILFTHPGFVNQLLTVQCSVRANPAQGVLFHWTFNSSLETYQQNVSLLFGIVCYCMVRYGEVWYVMVWYGYIFNRKLQTLFVQHD